MKTHRVLCAGAAALLIYCPWAPARPAPALDPGDRVSLRLDASEAERALAIVARHAAREAIADSDWRALFSCEPYRRLQQREAEIAEKFGAPDLKFTDEQFERFLLSDSLARQAPGLERTLEDWRRADLQAAARRVLLYLPAGARVRAGVFPMVKPRSNSFVYETATNPAIFLYLDPRLSRAKFENTVAHELHHIGFASVAAERDTLLAGLAPGARAAFDWIGAFGEGFAMLAAAGGPDVHPHAASPPEERARWDRDLAGFDRDLEKVQAFLLDVASGKLATEEDRNRVGYSFFGVQGPWYTVGWKMAVVIERRYGRARLIECMFDLRQLLPTYNRAAEELDRAGVEHLARWSPELLKAIEARAR